jgi:hypothetical protein
MSPLYREEGDDAPILHEEPILLPSDTPRTEAGRRLLYDPNEGYPEGLEEAMGPDATRWRDTLRESILAIEAEASAFACSWTHVAEASTTPPAPEPDEEAR